MEKSFSEFSDIHALKECKFICIFYLLLPFNTKFPGDDTKRAYILMIELLFIFIINGKSSL